MTASAGIVLRNGATLPVSVASANVVCYDPTSGMIGFVDPSGVFHSIQPMDVVGTAKNLKGAYASVTTATWSADETIVKTALGGIPYCVKSWSLTLNMATTGAGGLDTGAIGASTWYYVYLIWNWSTQTAALLATTSGSGVSVYGGANMPSGYTASALVGVFRSNGSSQVPTFGQLGNTVYVAQVQFTTTSTSTSNTQSLATVVPPKAKTLGGELDNSGPANTFIAVDSSGSGILDSGQAVTIFTNAGIVTASTTYFYVNANTGTMNVSQFTF